MIKKIIVCGVVVMICLGFLSACTDYGYEYHFSVVGGNGSISAVLGDEKCDSDDSPVFLLGGKRINHQLKFIATAADGYQVKEWTYNGEIVDENKTNSFTTGSVSYKQPIITITVEFEPMP